MADWLLIRLPSDPVRSASWIVADAVGRLVMPVQSGPLAQAASLAAGRRVCALVPAADVVLTDADVPAKAGVKVLQVVPFALEEHLAEDVDSLHFAVGRRIGDSPRTPVAVVSRALMEQWLGALREAGLTPEAMYAESELLPANPGQAVALLEDECAVVRPAGGGAVTMPLDALAEALELARPAAQETLTQERTGSGLILYTGPAEWQRCSHSVEALRDRFDGIKVQLLSDGPLALFAQRLPAAASSAINLLQGNYAPATALASNLKSWRLAAALLGALVLLHAVGSTAELLALKNSERKLDTAIADTFRQIMPGEHNASNARRRVEQRLAGSQGGADPGGLLAALAAVAQARDVAPGTNVESLTFHQGLLELRLTAPNAQVLDRLSQALRSSGWQADLTSGATTRGSGYEGRIQIKAKS